MKIRPRFSATSFVYFAHDCARIAARKARALRAVSRLHPNETQRHAEHRWESEGGNPLTPSAR